MKRCGILIIVTLILFTTLTAGQGKYHALSGAGATFPIPLYEAWFYDIQKDLGITIQYDAVGSGRGVELLKERQIDFGAADYLLDADSFDSLQSKIIQIPMTIGAVVLVYNLPNNPQLNLSPELITAIFMGKISNWKDSRIGAVNPQITFPDLPIRVIHRSDPSGTTHILSEFLSENSELWRQHCGISAKINWNLGMGVSETVK